MTDAVASGSIAAPLRVTGMLISVSIGSAVISSILGQKLRSNVTSIPTRPVDVGSLVGHVRTAGTIMVLPSSMWNGVPPSQTHEPSPLRATKKSVYGSFAATTGSCVSVKLVTGSVTATVPSSGAGSAVGWFTQKSKVAAPTSEAERATVTVTATVSASPFFD